MSVPRSAVCYRLHRSLRAGLCDWIAAADRKTKQGVYLMKRPPATFWRSNAPVGWMALVVAACLGYGGMVCACNVPVFRYALERWQPDAYRVTLFHRGALTEAQHALVCPLEEPSSGKRSANVVLRVVDVDEIQDDALRALLAAQSPAALPWLTVQYPEGLRIEKPVRSGPLADDAVARLVESPLRSELIRRLADGQTAVWLMLECGRSDQDDAVAAMLADELKRLSNRLQLPELTSAPEDALLSSAPLQVTFSLLRVPRGVAAEQPLVEMLLGSEPDLIELDEPMAFPVFGRGRALLPLIGAGITADNIHESAAFLVGACSCEVKELNPGFDLLLAADWEVLFLKESARRQRRHRASHRFVRQGGTSRDSLRRARAPATQQPESSDDPWFGSNYMVSFAVVSLLLAFVAMIAVKRLV